MAKYFQNLRNWVLANTDTIFAMWVYKHEFTPYEIKQCFTDQSIFEDSVADLVRIVDAINLESGDYLLGVQSYDEIDGTFYDDIDYYLLSDIKLTKKKIKIKQKEVNERGN